MLFVMRVYVIMLSLQMCNTYECRSVLSDYDPVVKGLSAICNESVCYYTLVTNEVCVYLKVYVIVYGRGSSP